jgi:hypothetical protein
MVSLGGVPDSQRGAAPSLSAILRASPDELAGLQVERLEGSDDPDLPWIDTSLRPAPEAHLKTGRIRTRSRRSPDG